MPIFTQAQVAGTFLGFGVPADRIDLTATTYAGIDRDEFFRVVLPAFHAYLAQIKASNGKTLADYDIKGAIQDNVCHDFVLNFRAWMAREWWVQMNAVTPPDVMADHCAAGGMKGPAPFDLSSMESHSWGWFIDLTGQLHCFETIPNVVTIEYSLADVQFSAVTGVNG